MCIQLFLKSEADLDTHWIWPAAFNLRHLGSRTQDGNKSPPSHGLRKWHHILGLQELRAIPLSPAPHISGKREFAAGQRGATPPQWELVQCSQIRSKQTQRKRWCSSKSTRFQGTLPLLFACPPLVAFCKHLLAHIFVSTIAFLTVNFRMSSQDKGICEQTEILIVAFCLAECSSSNICLCDTQGLPRAVGCPFAACPRLGDAHQWDLLPRHLATALAADPKLTNFGVPWQACTHGCWLAAWQLWLLCLHPPQPDRLRAGQTGP